MPQHQVQQPEASAAEPAAGEALLGWSGGIALTLGVAGFLLSLPFAYLLFQLSLEVAGWNFDTVWMGPGWLAGLLFGCVILLLAWRGGNPKAGAWLFLGMFLLWALMWPLMALASAP